VRAGRLNRRITIQARTDSQNTTGETVWTFADWKTVWASVEPTAGTETFVAQQTQSETTVMFRIRQLAGVTTKHRIKFTEGGVTRYYGIEAVLPVDYDRRQVRLMGVEREVDGWR